jgi:hypothetical protein
MAAIAVFTFKLVRSQFKKKDPGLNNKIAWVLREPHFCVSL